MTITREAVADHKRKLAEFIRAARELRDAADKVRKIPGGQRMTLSRAQGELYDHVLSFDRADAALREGEK